MNEEAAGYLAKGEAALEDARALADAGRDSAARVLDPTFHRWLLDAFDARQTAEYEVGASVTPTAAAQSIERATELLAAACAHLERA